MTATALTAAPPATPSMYGSASGLRRIAWNLVPLIASAPPVSAASSARGMRRSKTIARCIASPPPNRMSMTARKGSPAAPIAMLAVAISASATLRSRKPSPRRAACQALLIVRMQERRNARGAAADGWPWPREVVRVNRHDSAVANPRSSRQPGSVGMRDASNCAASPTPLTSRTSGSRRSTSSSVTCGQRAGESAKTFRPPAVSIISCTNVPGPATIGGSAANTNATVTSGELATAAATESSCPRIARASESAADSRPSRTPRLRVTRRDVIDRFRCGSVGGNPDTFETADHRP